MKCLLSIVLFAQLPGLNGYQQAVSPETQHFEKAGLAFDFPAKWELIDSSSQTRQYVAVGPKGSDNKVALVVQRAPISSCDFLAESQRLTNELLQETATLLHAVAPLRTSPVTTVLRNTAVSGVRLRGRLNGKPVTGEVYSVRFNQRYLSLVYLYADNEEQANSAWDTIRRTLTLAPGVLSVGAEVASAKFDPATLTGVVITTNSAASTKLDPPLENTVLSNRAYVLVQPPYPNVARMAHASGTVVVQVLIDESGSVVSAHAISGHPLLQATSVAAAKASKFSPTKLCGEAVRVTGVIQYNFLAQ